MKEISECCSRCPRLCSLNDLPLSESSLCLELKISPCDRDRGRGRGEFWPMTLAERMFKEFMSSRDPWSILAESLFLHGGRPVDALVLIGSLGVLQGGVLLIELWTGSVIWSRTLSVWLLKPDAQARRSSMNAPIGLLRQGVNKA